MEGARQDWPTAQVTRRPGLPLGGNSLEGEGARREGLYLPQDLPGGVRPPVGQDPGPCW